MKKTKLTTQQNKKLLLTSTKVRELSSTQLENVVGGWGGSCDNTFASAKPTFC